jgi:hypothetical protein
MHFCSISYSCPVIEDGQSYTRSTFRSPTSLDGLESHFVRFSVNFLGMLETAFGGQVQSVYIICEPVGVVALHASWSPGATVLEGPGSCSIAVPERTPASMRSRMLSTLTAAARFVSGRVSSPNG